MNECAGHRSLGVTRAPRPLTRNEGAHATGSKPRYFSRLPAGSRCTVSETADGHTHTVRVVATTKHKKTTISPKRTATTHLTDTFSRRRPPRPPPIGLG